jgi:hypothetical protein
MRIEAAMPPMPAPTMISWHRLLGGSSTKQVIELTLIGGYGLYGSSREVWPGVESRGGWSTVAGVRVSLSEDMVNDEYTESAYMSENLQHGADAAVSLIIVTITKLHVGVY